MRLAQLITEIGYEVDRTSIDDRIKYWIQQSVDILYGVLPKDERQRVTTITTVNAQQWLDVPTDYGDYSIIYDSNETHLKYIPPGEFFASNRAITSGTPEAFTVWNRQFLFAPVPNAAVAFTLNYHIEKPNIWTHNLTIEHKASMSGYVYVYLDEDGVESGEGKLLFVSPTSTDTKVLLQSADGHQHEIIVYHDAAAASKGVGWFFDENATNAYERNFFVSPTKADTVVKTENYRKHHHYLKFIHNPNPATYPDANNVAVYVSESVVARDLRFATISPTATNGTNELVHTPEGILPGFLERYHPVIHELCVAKGHRFNHNYEWATQHAQAASGILTLITGQPNKLEDLESKQE